MSLSVMGSVRDRFKPEPTEYKVSGVRAKSGRGPGDVNGGENRPGFAVESWRCGVFGDGVGTI
jgi:hypothetical protein